jgi:hypothetical protein
MLPGRALMSKLITDAIKFQATKQTSKFSPQFPNFEKAAEIQIALKEAEHAVKSAIPLSPEAAQAQELTIAAIKKQQNDVSGGVWALNLGLPKKKVPSNRCIEKKIKSKSGKHV